MKRSLCLLLLCAMTIMMVGCGNTEGSDLMADEGILIYSTVFPLEDFARYIGGQHVQVKNLIPTGTDAHDFELSAKDMAKVLESDLFIFNGAGLEPWAEQVVQNLDSSKTTILNSTEGLKLGQHENHDKETKKDHGHQHDHESVNPHVWLDPELAKQQAQKIRDALVKIDPVHKQTYQENYLKLEEKFNQLDEELKKMTNQAPNKMFVVSHNAFQYLAERYGLQQIAISGLSPSAEPSPSELKKMIDLVKKHQIQYILFETMVTSRVAEVIQKEANAQALTLHPLEGLTEKEAENGEDYFSIMHKNKEVLAKALGVKS